MLGQSASTEKLEEEKITNPEEWLKSKGFRFEYPSADQTMVFLGQDILEHYKTIESIVPEDSGWMLMALANYVEAPTVTDGFPSERKRNAFEKEEVHGYSKIRELFNSNKLKGGFISSNVFGIGEAAKSEGWLNPELANECERLKRQYKGPGDPPSGYDRMTIEEKITFTGEIANLAKSLYQTIAEKCTSETPK